MRRSAVSPFVMVLGLVVLLVAWRVPSLAAQSIECFRGCRANEKPPACCAPPPCSFWQELRIAKATVNIYSKANRLPAGDFIAEFLKLRGMKSCPETAVFRPPEPLEVSTDGKCRIGIYEGKVFKEQSPDEALANSKSCSEMVKAEFAKAQRAAAYCRSNLTRKKPLTKSDVWRQSRNAAQAKVDALEESLYGWFMACSTVPAADGEKKKEESKVEAGLKALEAKKAQALDLANKVRNWMRQAVRHSGGGR